MTRSPLALRQMRRWPVFGLFAAAAGQIAPTEAVVCIRLPGIPATQLWTIDVSNGATVALPRFPQDDLPATAIALDPVDRSVLLALDVGSATRIVRLAFQGRMLAGCVDEATIGPGVTEIAAGLGDWLAVRSFPSGGLDARARWPATQWSLPHGWLAGIDRADPASPIVHVAISQPRNYTFATLAIDLDRREVVPGSMLPLPRLLNGIVELPGPTLDLLVSHPDGSFTRLQPAVSAMPIPVYPSLWIGMDGVVAMHRAAWQTGSVFALGKGSFPFFYELDPNRLVGPNIVFYGPALPGTPVDFAPPAGSGARAVPWGERCRRFPADLQPIGLPSLGNASFALRLDLMQPSATFALLALGDLMPPQILPSRCPLFVRLDALVPIVVTSAVATVPVPVPNHAALLGTVVHAQALREALFPFATSNPLALHLDY